MCDLMKLDKLETRNSLPNLEHFQMYFFYANGQYQVITRGLKI